MLRARLTFGLLPLRKNRTALRIPLQNRHAFLTLQVGLISPLDTLQSLAIHSRKTQEMR